MTLQEYNDLYKQPLLKQMTIVSSGGIKIKNSNIVSEQMSLEKSLCSETNLRYGRCEAACFKVRIADINHDFTGEWLEVTQEVVTDDEGYLLLQNGQYLLTEDGYKIKLKNEQIDEATAVYGRFKVYSDKPSNDRRWRDLTCYDAMYDILNTDVLTWFNGLTFPMTIKNLRDSLFTYLGITQVTKTLINDNFSTPGGFSVSGSLSAKQVIEAICELNGVFGQITSDGKFDYVSLESPPTLTLDYYVDGTGSYEDYVTAAVTGINVKGTSNDVGVTVGTSTNLYIITGNPLVYGTEGTSALTTSLNTLLQHIMGVQYRPYGVTTYGNPMLPLGTKITINTKNQTIVSYVVKKTLSGIQSLKDTISATGDKHQPTAVNSPKSEIIRTQGKVHELEINVDGLKSRVSTTETNLANNYSTTQQMNSAIQQSATDITTQVSNTYVTQSAYNAEVQNLQDQIDGRIEYWDGNVVPTLNNAPASSWATTSAKDSHIGDLYRYHHGTPEVTDYYRFDKDSSTTPATYSWVALGESQVDEALRQAELANQKADAAQQQLDALQQSVEDDYYTKTQTDSQISQSASAITQSVSSTYETKSNATSHYNSLDSAAQGYANSALATANTNAQGYANDAKNAANSATDTKLQSYYTKTQTDSQISQTATGITQSVSSTYETKSDASAKLNTANSNAQTYANAARDSANASTDTKLQSYYTKSETNSQIAQTASSITSTVAQTYTTKSEFNALQVGGENLLRNTKNPILLGGTTGKEDKYIIGSGGTGTGSISVLTSSPVADVMKSFKITGNSANSNRDFQVLLPDFASDSVVANETQWTFSAYVRGIGGEVTALMRVFGTALRMSVQQVVGTSWTRIEKTFVLTAKDTTTIPTFQFGITGAGGIEYVAPKLERGNKATPWSPNSNDYSPGGENLWKDSTTITNPGGGATVSKDYNGIHGFTVTPSSPSTKTIRFSNVVDTAYELYTVSFKVLTTGATSIICDICDNFNQSFTIPANKWTEVVYTNYTEREINSIYHFIDLAYSGNSNLTVKDFKIEKGSTKTAWSPSTIESKSEIKQLSNQIVMKVDGNGNIVQVALSADPSTGTAFTVSANNIDFIADGNIQLTSGTIGIYSTNFQVTSDGTVTAKAGQIGGWKITSTQFYDAVADETGTTQGAGICKYGEGYAFWAGTSFANRNNAPFLVGHNGTLRASNAIISGTVTSSNLTATGGTVAGWTISSSDGLKHTDSVYGTSGFMHSLGWMFAINASNSTTLSDGRFRIDQLGTAYARSMYLTNQGGGYASLNSYNTVINNTQLIMKASNGTTQQVYMSGETGNASFKGNLTVSGTKNRRVETPNYGSKLLYCYETPTPMFGDIGEGKIAEDGKCYVWLDSTFSETIKTESYQVFLQKYGQGECYMTERTSRYFVVEGDAGMRFGWELKARQAGYENDRLESFIEEEEPMESYDYPTEAIRHLEAIQNEREVA